MHKVRIDKYGLSALLCLFLGIVSWGQQRYKDVVLTDVRPGTFVYTDTLKLDFYSAPGDTLSSKPLLLLVHGGGFASGKRDNPLEKSFSVAMAKKGFAVASISYRLLRKGKSFGCDCPAKEKITTFRTAAEDILLATDFLIDKSKELQFDPEKIILVGSSAGAEAVLNVAFLQHHHDFSDLPYKKIQFAGVIAFAGAVLDANYITDQNKIPVLLFHGEKDNLVPYSTAAHHHCAPGTSGYLMLAGSSSISDKIGELDGSYQLMYDPQGNHDWANLPYSKTETIARFILEAVIEGQNIQARIQVNP